MHHHSRLYALNSDIKKLFPMETKLKTSNMLTKPLAKEQFKIL